MRHPSTRLTRVAACIGALLALQPSLVQAQRRDPFDVEAREYLGTPRSEAAVQRGLDFLASRVQGDGHWLSGNYDRDAAVTGLCVLSFMSAGHQPGRGKYGAFLSKSVDWLAESVQRSGLVFRGGNTGQPMYGHGFATLALAELYGMTHRSDLRTKVEEAVRLICQAQNREGGWRYQPQQADADLSVTAVQVVALRAAANSGIKVPADTVKRAVGYIRKCQSKRDGGFSYQAGQDSSGPARTGAAILCLCLCGEKDSDEVRAGIKWLQTHSFAKNEWTYREYYSYCMYYCTQAFYQIGGESWKNWFEPTRDRLVGEQQKSGSWKDGPGEEYATAMTVLVLQVPAGLLPIYQK